MLTLLARHHASPNQEQRRNRHAKAREAIIRICAIQGELHVVPVLVRPKQEKRKRAC